MKELIIFIRTCVNFNILITLEGMNAGYFTSPLIDDLELRKFEDVIRGLTDVDHVTLGVELSEHKRALNTARRFAENNATVKEYKVINGMPFPVVEPVQITAEMVAKYRDGV